MHHWGGGVGGPKSGSYVLQPPPPVAVVWLWAGFRVDLVAI